MLLALDTGGLVMPQADATILRLGPAFMVIPSAAQAYLSIRKAGPIGPPTRHSHWRVH